MQIAILELLRVSPNAHCVKLLHVLTSGSWSCTAGDVMYQTAVLAPLCSYLQRKGSRAKEFVQVAADVAAAVQHLQSLNILHRDISANNIGILCGRGVLFDFSAGKVRSQ